MIRLKKVLMFILSAILILNMTACGSEDASKKDNVVDLTKLESTMLFAEAYNLVTNVDNYVGKKVIMKGQFAAFKDPNTGKIMTACLIYDEEKCCTFALVFTLSSGAVYPIGYPKAGATITISGTYTTYEEKGQKYYALVDAVLEQ